MRTSRGDPTKQWDKHYSQLKSYFQKHGHAKVPKQNNELSEWVQHQRSERRKGTLTEHQISQLDRLEFDWGKNAIVNDNFEEMLQQLQDFKAQKGHTRAPLTSNLGVWCQKQRTKLRDDAISADHRARLEAIGLDYELPRQSDKNKRNNSHPSWETHCDQLAAFYQDHGHFVLPKKQQPLHAWVARQRKAYKDGRLPKERRDKLDALHFIWTEAAAVESKQTWDANYDQLKRFKQRKGHSFVQRDDDVPLWRWTEKNDWKQRRGTLPRKRYERLASIGFWDPAPENLSERGDTTHQDETDTAFVVGSSSSEDGAVKNNQNAKSGAESEPEEELSDDNYDEEEAADSSDEEILDEDEDEDDDTGIKPRATQTKRKKAAAAKSRGKTKRKPAQNKSRRKKRLRRSSTFEDDEAFSTRYQVGTKVMKHFEEHGWFQGEIISIYEQNVYKIRYEDEDEETYLLPDEQKGLDRIVANTDILRHGIGTNVKKLFEGHGWFEGKIVSWEEDRYRIRYNDGDNEDYLFSELKELDELVANARSQ